MCHESIDLGEAVLVEEKVEPLARRELAARVLLLQSTRSPALPRLVAHRRRRSSLSAVDTDALLRTAFGGGPGRNRTCDRPVMSRLL